MKERLKYILYLYMTLLLIFVIEKPLFMIYNSINIKNVMDVIRHGLVLDAVTIGYIISLPLLFILATIWLPFREGRIPLQKIVKPYYWVISFIMSLIFVVDTSLYGFWGFKLDSTIFFYIDSPKDAMASVSIWYILIRITFIALFTYVFCIALKKTTPHILNAIKGIGRKVIYTLVMIILIGITMISIRGGVTESTANVSYAYFSPDQKLNHAAVNPVFNFFVNMDINEDFASEFRFYKDDKYRKVVENLFPHTDNNTEDILNTKRPDILMIVMEGFGAALVEACGGAKDVAPNLTRYAKEGVFFSNAYAGSFRTDRGLVCILSGYLGQPTTSIMKLHEKCEKLPSIARSLREQGYRTHLTYGGDINFTNMKGYFLSTGFEDITTNTDFTPEEQKGNAWGVNDHVTMQRTVEEVKKMKSPWFYTLMTLSSHEPFIVPYNKYPDNDIYNSFAYTDHYIGEMVEALRNSPLWKNLLIVLVPDHSIRNMDFMPELQSSSPDFYHIPLILIGGAIKEHRVVKTLSGQTDIPATILGQMGIDHKDFMFSRNVLSADYTYPFVFSSYNNGFVFRDSTGVTVYDNDVNKVIHNIPVKNQARLEKGQMILQFLYDDLASK